MPAGRYIWADDTKQMLRKTDFGPDFKWGVTISAFQNEGAAHLHGKAPSIWDAFTGRPDIIKNGDRPGDTCDFYHRYEEDVALAARLNFGVFRFSISWPRLLPDVTGEPHPEGAAFYNRVIDCCLANGLEPWVTVYHWDLPQELEAKGGWTHRDIIGHFAHYTRTCARLFGDRVKHWIVMNEPMTFVGMGYFMGYHAPGRTGIGAFLPAAHHAVLCMAQGGRIIREMVDGAKVGVALSCSYIEHVDDRPLNRGAARRVEALLNRFFLEPLLGMGYPTDAMPALHLIRRYMRPGDTEMMAFDFDFIGLQYYFRIVTRFSITPPILFAEEVAPASRKAKLNLMDLDVYPKGLQHLLDFYGRYPQIKSIILSESGVCFPDFPMGGHIHDHQRRDYHRTILHIVKDGIKKKKLPIHGYFAWTLVDNFEWREGFTPRFGLVHNNFITQQRTIKDSGKWFRQFLK